MRADVRAGVEGERRLGDGKIQPPPPIVDDRRELDPRRASRRRRAPSVTVCRVQARLPADDLLLVAAEREAHRPPGRARASSAASSASTPAPCFAPKPPPMYSEITRTCSGARPKRRASSRRASNMPCVDTQAVSASPSQRATAACGSSGDLHVGGRLAGQLDAGVGRRERGVGVAADGLARLLGEPLLGEPRLERRAERSASNAGASAARPAAAASGVSAATTAIGVARPRGSAVRRAVAAHRQRALRADHGPYAGRRRALRRGRARSRGSARPARAGRARGASPAADVDGVARARRSRARGPSWRVAGVPTTSSSASSGHVSTSSSSSTSTQTSSKRPSISRWDLTKPGLHATSCPEARRIARSIFGYAPQRQMLPAMRGADLLAARPRDARRGARSPTRSGPGVQKPHWSASSATNASWSAAAVAGEALDRRHGAALGRGDRQEAGGDGRPVEEDGARAAGALAAAVLRSR